MREYFQEVLALQLAYSSENTPLMARRGKLIRDVIPEEMRTWGATQMGAARPFSGRLNVQGRDGTGQKTFIPWVRIHSPELSPSAQAGWYAVYLFRADGEGVALCVSHGSTQFDGRDFVPRGQAEVDELMHWGRSLLNAEALALGFRVGVDLGPRLGLGPAYERTTAFSKMYASDNLPSDAQLMADAANAVGLVGQLYRAAELGQAPETIPPEIAETEAALQSIARPTSGGRAGQGFGLTHAERCLVEQRAMTLALGWLQDNGFTNIRDVHAKESCDFIAEKAGNHHYIEVKGTTARPGQVLLTANEVMLHTAKHPYNHLILVHGIELQDLRTRADGGKVIAFEAFDLAQCCLKALSYSCQLPINR